MDSPDIPYESRMYRTGRPYKGRGYRKVIWDCWVDGDTVREFCQKARKAIGRGNPGPEDLRIFWRDGVVKLDPRPTVAIGNPR
jgi:hypothetical protein